MEAATKAPGQIPISWHLLRMVLDLPRDLELVGVQYLHPDDEMILLVTGDRVADGARLSPVYRKVDVGQAVLDNLAGKELVRVEGMADG